MRKSKTNRFLVIILLSINILSCTSMSKDRQYVSLDYYTGGFINFNLILEKNGDLRLLIETFIAIEENDSGTSWKTRKKEVNGNWKGEKGKIRCDFIVNKNSMDSIFLNTNFEEITSRELIRFNSKMDTVFIYGFPCIEIQENINNQKQSQ